MKSEHNTNFTEFSILMATSDLYSHLPLFPEPPHVNVEEIWPDDTIDWLREKKKERK